MGERVQEICEPCEGNRDTGERLDAIKMVEDKPAIALHCVRPNRDSFVLAIEVPERFALFLASENYVFALG